MERNIVMIHGMWGGGWYLEKYKTFFEERGYQCHTPYLRYHDVDPKAEPDPRLGTTSLLDYAQDLEEYIKEKKLNEKPILMGHSMGGLLAQMLGARGVASALVLLTPASPAGIVALKFSVIKTFRTVLFKWGFWKNPHTLPFKKSVYGMMHLMSEEKQREHYDQCVHESGKAATEIAFWLQAARVDESKVTCPVLVISGKEDRITPASVGKKVAKKYGAFPDNYKCFDGHAHMVVCEPGWEDVAGFAEEWLKEQGQASVHP
ncbi:MAG: alpha/beta hydrolase [Deltaproteobacteria bacterium]|nr:alpha/beta hydrolase [Deltaproteobacteria bacterium]